MSAGENRAQEELTLNVTQTRDSGRSEADTALVRRASRAIAIFLSFSIDSLCHCGARVQLQRKQLLRSVTDLLSNGERGGGGR